MGKGKEKEQQVLDENKKWMHREKERQRRQEMGELCTTLRSLLPLEYIKGKRSTSDHMYEAVNYINHLQNKVKQLKTKRDELMKKSNLSIIGPEIGSSTSTTHLPPYVVVHPLPGGVEIMCNYSFRNCVFPLSRVLDILLKEGLNVVSSTSTQKNGRFIHTIRSEDPNINGGTDFSELQRKLIEAISSSSKTLLQNFVCLTKDCLQGLQETLTEPENCLYLEKDVLFGEAFYLEHY